VLDAGHTDELRDVVLAVFGHDLRTPLAAVASGTKLLSQAPDLAHRAAIVLMLERSVARMRELIDTLLACSRDGLTGRLCISRREGGEIESALRSLVDELGTACSGRAIVCTFGLQFAVECDMARVIQLAANLLSNALVHGRGGPVDLRATSSPDGFELLVTNSGEPLPPDVVDRASRPLEDPKPEGRHGLGLGLYIASAIAGAHKGGINITYKDGRVCVSFLMPIAFDVSKDGRQFDGKP
jgi:signal transduction histidine kinase